MAEYLPEITNDSVCPVDAKEELLNECESIWQKMEEYHHTETREPSLFSLMQDGIQLLFTNTLDLKGEGEWEEKEPYQDDDVTYLNIEQVAGNPVSRFLKYHKLSTQVLFGTTSEDVNFIWKFQCQSKLKVQGGKTLPKSDTRLSLLITRVKALQAEYNQWQKRTPERARDFRSRKSGKRHFILTTRESRSLIDPEKHRPLRQVQKLRLYGYLSEGRNKVAAKNLNRAIVLSDRFYDPDQACGRLFNKELEDWKNLIAHIVISNNPEVLLALGKEELQKTKNDLEMVLSTVQSKNKQLEEDLKREQQWQEEQEQVVDALNRIEEEMKTQTEQLSRKRALQQLQNKMSKVKSYKEGLLNALGEFLGEHFPIPEKGGSTKKKKSFEKPAVELITLHEILEILIHKLMSTPHDPYVTINDSFWPPYIELLLRYGIALRHPEDPNRMRLEAFHM